MLAMAWKQNKKLKQRGGAQVDFGATNFFAHGSSGHRDKLFGDMMTKAIVQASGFTSLKGGYELHSDLHG